MSDPAAADVPRTIDRITVSDGTGLTVETIGDPAGAPVLVMHGFGSNRTANWLDAGWAAPLAEAGLRGLAFDLRGHGDSDKPAGPEHYTPEAFLADIHAVLDWAGLERAGILGYSFGSRLAWEFGLRYPQRATGLVLGGLGYGNPMTGFAVAAARAYLADGTPIPEPTTAALLTGAALLPGNDLDRLVDIAQALQEAGAAPIDPAVVPPVPLLLATGQRDEIATGAADLAHEIGAEFTDLGPRSHTSAITARGFKAAAVASLARWA